MTIRLKSVALALFVALALLPVSSSAQAGNSPADAILGVWHTTDDESRVLIFKQSGRYFGKIISLKQPNWPSGSKLGTPGTPKNDRNNPNPALRSNPVLGLQLMGDLQYAGRNRWTGGHVYDPKSGKTYHGKITLVAPNRLELRGYVGFSLLGRTVIWTR